MVKDVFSGRIRGAKIDVDEAEVPFPRQPEQSLPMTSLTQDLAQEFGIKAMPTFKIFKDKKPVYCLKLTGDDVIMGSFFWGQIAEVVGAAEAKLRSAIEKALDE